jgi:hypothetical protein
MNMNSDQIRKIRALALHSTNANERAVAQQILERLGQPIEEETPLCTVEIRYNTRLERRLAFQVICTVMGSNVEIYRVAGKRTLVVDCSPGERQEIELLYTVYRRELNTLLDRAYIGFIHKNMIFPPDGPIRRRSELDEDDLAALALAEAMTKVTVPRGLLDAPRIDEQTQGDPSHANNQHGS